MDCSPPVSPLGSSVHGILQARTLEWVAILQGIFPTQGSNPGLPPCRLILHHLSHLGSVRGDYVLLWCCGHWGGEYWLQLLAGSTGWHSCDLLVTISSSTNQHMTWFCVCFCLKTPHLIPNAGALTPNLCPNEAPLMDDLLCKSYHSLPTQVQRQAWGPF